MKKLFLSMILCLSLNNSIQAQQAYTNLLEKAKSTLNDQNAYPMVKQISQFKKDALEYLSMKMKTDMPDSSTNYLDKQALALDNFVNYYIQNLLNSQSQPAAYQVKIMKIFMDATVSNPLFNDKEKDITWAYFNNAKSITRFSLDTDWPRATVAAINQIEKEKSKP